MSRRVCTDACVDLCDFGAQILIFVRVFLGDGRWDVLGILEVVILVADGFRMVGRGDDQGERVLCSV
jgi:hypothetical protein